MTSNLKWRAGFGWSPIILCGAAIAIAIFSAGIVRILAVIGSLVALGFIIYQWRKWNKRGWPQIHFRAMLAYAKFSAEEMKSAQREGREFNRVPACRALALAITGSNREANVDAMISDLVRERGEYFVMLLNKFGPDAGLNLKPEGMKVLIESCRQQDFGPHLVIANIVENSFGGEEAARYVVALATREAH